MIKYLLEIKNRLVFVTISLVFTLFVSYLYKEILLFLIIKPGTILNVNSDLFIFYFIFTDLTEVFSVYLRLVFFITTQFTVFYLIYHCFIFLNPALFKTEYYLYKNILITCFLTWFFSIIVSKYLLIPLSWAFFFSFQNFISNKFISLYFEPKINEYLNFCLFLYYSCIFYCQFFVVLFITISNYNNGLISVKKYRKFYYFGFFIFSTFISPPDVFSQLILSISLIIIYEFSVIVIILKSYLIW